MTAPFKLPVRIEDGRFLVAEDCELICETWAATPEELAYIVDTLNHTPTLTEMHMRERSARIQQERELDKLRKQVTQLELSLRVIQLEQSLRLTQGEVDLHMLVYGDCWSGFSFTGPFLSKEAAESFARNEITRQKMRIVPLTKPKGEDECSKT